jgi:hypothetical protein
METPRLGDRRCNARLPDSLHFCYDRQQRVATGRSWFAATRSESMTPESYKAARLDIALRGASISEPTDSERPEGDDRELESGRSSQRLV